MSNNIPPPSQPKIPFHNRNGSDELDVFQATRYFSSATENFIDTRKMISDESKIFDYTTQKNSRRPIGRMSLDMPNNRGNSIPLKAMLIENNPIMVNKDKKSSKQPSSPGGKLAQFLNSLFNQTSLTKSKSKPKSTKDEDESPSGWRRKRRSSISHLRSANSNSTTTTTTTATIMSDAKSPFSTSTSSGFRTPPPCLITPTPTKTTNYKDPRSYSDLNPPASKITKIPISGNLNKIETFDRKIDFFEKKMSFGNGFDEKEDKYVDVKEFKRFSDEDYGDSDSSSDLFELTNYDLGYYPNGLPVYETTHMGSIKRGAPISS